MTIYRVEVLVDIEAEDAESAMLAVLSSMEYMQDTCNDDEAIQQCLVSADVKERP